MCTRCVMAHQFGLRVMLCGWARSRTKRSWRNFSLDF
jgi:hypothetical protein